jgi:hypothetical protein
VQELIVQFRQRMTFTAVNAVFDEKVSGVTARASNRVSCER